MEVRQFAFRRYQNSLFKQDEAPYLIFAIEAVFIAIAFAYYPFFVDEFETPKVYSLIFFSCLSLFFIGKPRFNDRIFLGLSLFTLSTFISAFFSIDRHLSFFGNLRCPNGALVTWSYLILYMVMSRANLKPDFSNRIIKTLIFCSAMVSTYAICQVFGFDFKQWNGTVTEFGYTRPMSTLGHPNFMAAYLSMILPFTIFQFEQEKKGTFRLLYAMAFVLSIAAITVSISRGMILSAIGGLSVYALMRRPPKRQLLRLLCLIIFIACLMIIVSPKFQHLALWRLKLIFSPGPPRMEYYAGALKLWLKAPFFGVGTDAFEIAYHSVRSAYYWQIEPFGTPHRAHNDILNLMATQGTVGLLTWLFFNAAIVKRAMESKSQYLIPCVSALVIFFIQGMSSFSIVSTTTIFLFACVLLKHGDPCSE